MKKIEISVEAITDSLTFRGGAGSARGRSRLQAREGSGLRGRPVGSFCIVNRKVIVFVRSHRTVNTGRDGSILFQFQFNSFLRIVIHTQITKMLKIKLSEGDLRAIE